MAAASGRRCHYEVLGLRRESTADEIRSAYKKLALQLHPDKLVQSGLSQSEATARFQELSQAYEVLSDPKERAWYDSHRSQILFADPNSADSVPDSVIPNLFSFFSNSVFSGYSDIGKGFYKVYSDVFSKIYANELSFASRLGLGLDAVREAPAMGNLESPYTQVTAFYGYWLGFSTVMDFCWVDQYDAMAGVNRKSRRVMEEENKKLRKKGRREYNETVRGLAEFVKKRDKRVIDMAVKKNLEMEKRREEERERKNKMERERLERAMAYKEPEWSRIGEEEEAKEEENVVEEVEEKKELYCVVCGKKFKSEKQWKNHEQSKKHREKVAEFRESVGDEEFEDDLEGEDGDEKDGQVEELEEKMRDGFQIGEEEEVELSNGDDDEFGEVGAANGVDEDGEKVGFDAEDDEDRENANNGDDDNVDDEIVVLEAMLGRRRNRKKNGSLPETNGTLNSINVHVENDDDDDDFMDYNKRKTTRRNRRARKERSDKNGEEAGVSRSEKSKESNGDENLHHQEESSSRSVAENESNGKEDDLLADNKKSSNQHVDKKGKAKNDTNAKSKNSSKGKKAKVKM